MAETSQNPAALSRELTAKRDHLVARIRELDSCAVAFSAGVDSTVVAMAAQLAIGNRAVAVTAVSPSLASGELEQAEQLALRIGIRHEVIRTDELARDGYRENSPQRCYFCKTELYEHLESILERLQVKHMLNGANLDDLGDHRPGMRAASEHHVRSPLIEAGISKDEVRQLAAAWSLPVWNKPASPCLSSRIAYGEEVTTERLEMVDRAEQFLRSLGVSPVRVRYHRGDLARIEAPLEHVARLAAAETRGQVAKHFQHLGFRAITLDLEGFRSGSLNQLVQINSNDDA